MLLRSGDLGTWGGGLNLVTGMKKKDLFSFSFYILFFIWWNAMKDFVLFVFCLKLKWDLVIMVILGRN